jgi:hypothetical protein
MIEKVIKTRTANNQFGVRRWKRSNLTSPVDIVPSER